MQRPVAISKFVCPFAGILLSAGTLFGIPAAAQVSIDERLGVDPRVNYAALTRFGPWDDRNYRLTAEDLAVLPAGEDELREPIPAFFRVKMRRAWPTLPTVGSAQYPRSALNIFRQMYGGYLVDGKLYNRVSREGGRYRVILEDGIPSEAFEQGGSTRFLSGEVRVTSPEGAAEAAVKVHPSDTSRVIAGSNGPGGGQKMHYSTDGGETWTETTLPQGGTCCDPSVDWSSDGTKAYATTLGACGFSGCDVWFYRSDDGGQTWSGLENVTPGDPRREITNGGSDKEFIHVDQSPTSPFQDNIYITWHDSNVMKVAVSTDDGNTFTTQSFSSLTENRGIGSDITTDAAGNVYYFWPGTNSRTIRLSKSTDGGVSFGAPSVVASTQASFIFPVPSMETREVFVYVSADTDRSNGPFAGSVYATWTDSTGPTSSNNPSSNHARIQVAYSRDGGSSWTVTTPHETADATSVDRWHQWLAVGPDGRVHVVFYDTRRDPSRTSVDLFFSTSDDGAQTWSAPERVTAELSPNIADSFEFGDYNGLDIVLNDLIAIFTDNRDESGGGGDSVDVYASGISFCAQPPPPLLAVDAVAVGQVDLGWNAVAGADSYNLYRSSTGCGSVPMPIGSTASTSFSDTAVVNGQAYAYVVRSVENGCESNGSNCVQAILAPRVVYEGHVFCDGNGDGFPDPGETLAMPLTVINEGGFDASAISATISTSTAGIAVDDPTADFPDLASSASGWSLPPHFSWGVGAGVACGQRVDFTLQVDSSQGSWSSPFQVLVGDAMPVTESAGQSGSSALGNNSAAVLSLTPAITVPGPATAATVVPPTLTGYSASENLALVQIAAVSPGGASQTLKGCNESVQMSYDVTALYNGPGGGPGPWSLCVSTGNAEDCTGVACSRQVGPWPDLGVSASSLDVSGAFATCSPNSGVGSCGPREISSVFDGEPALIVGPGSPTVITVEADPLVTAYNVYHDMIGLWSGNPSTVCGITAWTDNGDGTASFDVAIPGSSWILVTGSNAEGEGALGPNAFSAERSLVGSWTLCGAYP